ncbi:NAD(P)-dependent oxidoreductase [Paenibacillus sp. J22TS3]|uniref:NAD(P)-dependent oxidoreductase n=1 Tax=Paenibacillus sp. J22TS3 TaxID=2807192 RepID=UPI001B0C908F|nr:NAD(P)-dependent oxidoreductase [Paenibacillus sp. J22TS3]GIP24279.1 putative oxidoreductase YfjR [Paenibacillus sp. J22TS3]
MRGKIGFIGLGQLGLPIAANLLQAGYALTVYNRTADKAEPVVAQGALQVDSPADTVTAGGIVVTLVWDDEALEDVVRSEGFLERLGPGGIHVSMSTVSPDMGRKLADLHTRHGSVYVEAPIFGRPEAAIAKQLWIPVAGAQEAKERVRPVLEAMGARGIFDFGEEAGTAVLVKLIGNFLIVSAARSLEEALGMAERGGVDPKAAVNMLTSTLFTAPIYQSYGKMIAEKSAAVSQSKIPQKDVGLFLAAAQNAQFPAPLAGLLLDMLEDGDRSRQ